MERVYFIEGLDCANCAAKLERHLKDISFFDNVIIDFMAQKMILTVKDEQDLIVGLQEAKKVIAQIEPGVMIVEKKKKKKENQNIVHNHGEHCDCGHDHAHEAHNHVEHCDHAHEAHNHGEHCDYGCDHTHKGDGHKIIETKESSGVATMQMPKTVKKAGSFTPEMKSAVTKLAIGAVLFLLGEIILLPELWRFGVFLLAYLIVGGEIVLRAAKNIIRGQVFDENFLMSVATIGAFCIGDYPEGVMVMLLYQLGELFQDYAVHRSRRSIADLMDIKPEFAHVKRGGSFIAVDPDEVALGDTIQIRPGEKVPLDGVVLEGSSALNTVALTGESVPREVVPGEQVLSGCINMSGLLTVRVEKEYEDSTVAKILDLVENASSKKANAENFITRFARYYTPAVVGIAVLLAVVPPLVLGDPFSQWIYRALVFLVISCPCALVISIPLTFFGGLGACSRHGVLVKGSNYLEALAKLEGAVFDKTGTLTKGQFAVTEIHPVGITEEQLLYYAACAESVSNHPIAQAVQKANKQSINSGALQSAEEIAGHGISAVVEGHTILAGNYRMMERYQVTCNKAEETGTIIYLALDGIFCGWIVIADEIKPDAQKMIQRLKELGVQQVIMLTGDNKKTAEKVAGRLGITQVFSQLLPGDKVICLEQVMQQKTRQGTISFTGDGLNDAPVLARADVGIAMGGLGSDAAIEAADVVIMNDQLSKLADAVVLARETRRIVKQNIIFILSVKLVVLILGALGIASMWMAVFADVGVAVLAILNAVRIMRK